MGVYVYLCMCTYIGKVDQVHTTTFDVDKATSFCKRCQCFVVNETASNHLVENGHILVERAQWSKPTTFLAPLAHDKSNAQYFFSDTTTTSVLSMLSGMKCRRILCVGAPTIHQAVTRHRFARHIHGQSAVRGDPDLLGY